MGVREKEGLGVIELRVTIIYTHCCLTIFMSVNNGETKKLTHFYLQLGVLLQQVLQEVQIMWETCKFAVKVGTNGLNLM